MFLAVLFIVALSVWFIPMIERARLPMLGAIVLIIGTVFGPAFYSINGPLQVSIDRVLFVIVCIVAFFSLRGLTARIPQLNGSDWLVALYVGWVLVSTRRGDPPVGSSPLGSWIFYVLLPAMMYGVVRVAKLKDIDLNRLEVVFLGLGLYLAITGFFESRGWYSLVFPRFIGDPTNWEFLGRARGPLLNPSANGILLTVGLSIAAIRFLRAERAGKLGYGIATLFMMLGIYSTLTRSVWIGGFVALAIIFWQVTPRWTKALGLCTVILLAGFVAAGLKDQLLRMKRDKNLSAAESEKSVQLRPLLAIIAFEMMKDAPITGHGFGLYQEASKRYFSIRSYGMPLEVTRGYHQHNVLLSIAVNTGLIGLTLFTVLFVRWTRGGWQLSKNRQVTRLQQDAGILVVASLAGYFVGGMFQDVTIMPMINMYLFFFAGLIVNLIQASAEQTAPATSSSRTPERIRLSLPSICDQETEAVDEWLRPSAS